MREFSHTTALADVGGLEKLLSFAVRSMNIAVSRDLDAKLSGLDIAKGTGKISTLLVIWRYPGIRPSVIADIIMRDRSSMGRLLDKMIAQGLIIRREASDDGRSQSLYLTASGRLLAKRVSEITARQDKDFFQLVSDRDKEFIITLFNKVLLHYQQRLPC